MRPVYETPADKRRESDVLEYYAQLMNTGCVGTKRFSYHDGCLIKDSRLFERVEIKVRTNHSSKYRDYMLSYDKFRKLLEAEATGVCPVVLLVMFIDGLFRCYLPPHSFSTGDGGRTDRGDPADIERVVYIPLELFVRIG